MSVSVYQVHDSFLALLGAGTFSAPVHAMVVVVVAWRFGSTYF
jgi:hypothetical protein